jgi:cytochrome c-type biogenesis protein CcmH/NrfG
LILQMNTNPRDANGAVQLAQAYAQQGQTAKAVEWYQKALQLDALYQTGVNRMAVYDALAGLQQ